MRIIGIVMGNAAASVIRRWQWRESFHEDFLLLQVIFR